LDTPSYVWVHDNRSRDTCDKFTEWNLVWHVDCSFRFYD